MLGALFLVLLPFFQLGARATLYQSAGPECDQPLNAVRFDQNLASRASDLSVNHPSRKSAVDVAAQMPFARKTLATRWAGYA